MADERALNFFGVDSGNSAIAQGPALLGPLVVPYGMSILWKDSQGRYWQQFLDDVTDPDNPSLAVRQVVLP